MRINPEGATGVPPTAGPEPSARAGISHSPTSPSSFERLIRGVGGAIGRGDDFMERAASTQYSGLDAAELIALQAGIYRYSEAVDLTAKLVDRLTGAARTVLEAGR